MTVHVYPVREEAAHHTQGTECACGPEIRDEGKDDAGNPAIVVIHRAALN